MKLYGSLTSPYVRKVRVFAAESGCPVALEVEDPWQVSPRLIGLNPVGKVPVLVLDDGRRLIESLLIIQYLDSVGDPSSPLIPPQAPAHWDALYWNALANGLIEAAVARLLELRRPADKQMPERIAREERRFAEILGVVEQALPAGAWLVGDALSIADLMLGVALRYAAFRYPHPWQPGHPKTAAWLDRIAARRSFADTEPPGAA